jgi:hypothetical protein
VNAEVAEPPVSGAGLVGDSSGVTISRGGLRIEVARGFDSPTLAAVLSLLGAT